MWKPIGFILYKGEYPISSLYLVHDTINDEFTWTDDSNKATIFPAMEYVKSIFSGFNESIHTFRLVVVTDEVVR